MSESDEDLDLEFDFWPQPRLEKLIEGLRSKWANNMCAPMSPKDWEAMASAAELSPSNGPDLERAVLQEFTADNLHRIEYPDGAWLYLGASDASESRLCCQYHGIQHILNIFSHEVDALWAADGINYMTVVVGPHNDLHSDLTEALRFVGHGLADSGGRLLLCVSAGSGCGDAVAMAQYMQTETGHSLEEAKAWYIMQRPGFDMDALDAELTRTLEHHETMLSIMQEKGASGEGKRLTEPGSPESPGKRVRQEVCDQIEEFTL